MQLEQAIRTRRTHKAYGPDPVECVAAYIVLLNAHARGLAGYWRTVPLLDDPRGREILGLPAQEAPVGLLYLGSPVQEQRVPQRAPLEQFVSYLN